MSLYPRKPSKPFGLPSTPFNPQTGAFMPLSEPGAFAEMTVVEVGHDVLLCLDREGRKQLVLKPWALRRSSFDGLTLGGLIYTTTGIDQRTATGPDGPVSEAVVKPYLAGEKIMAYRRHELDAAIGVVVGELSDGNLGSHRLFWEDMNTAGRTWTLPSDAVQGQAGTFYVAIVTAPSTEGKQEFYTVDIHGQGVSTLSDPPTEAAAIARSTTPTSTYFYRGEVVMVRRVDGEWLVYKFFLVNREPIPPGSLWVRPFCLDAPYSSTITYDTEAGNAPRLCLQDVAFDYDEIKSVLDTSATLLEVLGDFRSTHTIHAVFLPSNMVPVAPDPAVSASVCSIIPGKAVHRYGNVTGLGATFPDFVGAFTSNEGPVYSGTLSYPAASLYMGVMAVFERFGTGFSGVRRAGQTILSPARIGATKAASSSAWVFDVDAWRDAQVAAASAAKPSYVTTRGSVARQRASAVLVASWCADDFNQNHILSFRFVPPTLVWKGTHTTAQLVTINPATPFTSPQVWS